ncbi:PAAR-like protein [Cysteiniphilum sp. QT6929]|uniref:PAAR-like protein n=1 Tax=Cysteiniphilum sp. QT6929 TaxID=2975055 RepID=UPI0024B352F7|nr:PAAR-like protein [Cysteiniphilum sp. QT6929]WHN65523.1 DUF4280 domain-containing protein [Cysteiniphilum sp. QT6929]
MIEAIPGIHMVDLAKFKQLCAQSSTFDELPFAKSTTAFDMPLYQYLFHGQKLTEALDSGKLYHCPDSQVFSAEYKHKLLQMPPKERQNSVQESIKQSSKLHALAQRMPVAFHAQKMQQGLSQYILLIGGFAKAPEVAPSIQKMMQNSTSLHGLCQQFLQERGQVNPKDANKFESDYLAKIRAIHSDSDQSVSSLLQAEHKGQYTQQVASLRQNMRSLDRIHNTGEKSDLPLQKSENTDAQTKTNTQGVNNQQEMANGHDQKANQSHQEISNEQQVLYRKTIVGLRNIASFSGNSALISALDKAQQNSLNMASKPSKTTLPCHIYSNSNLSLPLANSADFSGVATSITKASAAMSKVCAQINCCQDLNKYKVQMNLDQTQEALNQATTQLQASGVNRSSQLDTLNAQAQGLPNMLSTHLDDSSAVLGSGLNNVTTISSLNTPQMPQMTTLQSPSTSAMTGSLSNDDIMNLAQSIDSAVCGITLPPVMFAFTDLPMINYNLDLFDLNYQYDLDIPQLPTVGLNSPDMLGALKSLYQNMLDFWNKVKDCQQVGLGYMQDCMQSFNAFSNQLPLGVTTELPSLTPMSSSIPSWQMLTTPDMPQMQLQSLHGLLSQALNSSLTNLNVSNIDMSMALAGSLACLDQSTLLQEAAGEEAAHGVANGAILKCPYSLQPITLIKLPNGVDYGVTKTVVTQQDQKPVVNILPSISCLHPQRVAESNGISPTLCPALFAPFNATSNRVTVYDQEVVTANSKLSCSSCEGVELEIIDANQSTSKIKG